MFIYKIIYKICVVKILNFIFLFFINYGLEVSDFHYIEFTSKHYRAGHFAFNSNKDMIIEYSYNKYRLFFGLKQNGRAYFKYNEDEEYTKEIIINRETPSEYTLYESRNIFITLRNFGKKQYLLSVSNYSFSELYNLDNINYQIIESYNFFKNGIYTLIFPQITDNNNNYYIMYISQNYKNIMIYKFMIVFGIFEFFFQNCNNPKIIQVNCDHRTVAGFFMNEKIIAIYLTYYPDNGYYYCYNVYDNNLSPLREKYCLGYAYFCQNKAIFLKEFI